jgi:hypothetical protein
MGSAGFLGGPGPNQPALMAVQGPGTCVGTWQRSTWTRSGPTRPAWELPVEDLPALLERCAVEHSRVAAVERLAHARLVRELPGLARATEGLLTARQAAKRLGVSPDYVRAHGEALGLAVHLDGVVRYDPAAIDCLRRQRREQLPRE